MVRALLAVSLLLLPSVAFAGGSQNAQPRVVAPFGAPRVLAANSPVKPGQTWILGGTTASGQKISREIVLGPQAPTWNVDGWAFESEIDILGYHPVDNTLYVTDLSGMVTGDYMTLCMGFLEAGIGRGALLTGSVDEMRSQLAQLDNFPDPKSASEALATMRAAGLNVGTCTLTLKK
ncbi:hypothetical protein GO986_03350 [Deinococcus sp. HMF7620]|uniref:Uncharacterized protein n=1 Tax=Deinococcus arboris TaxID=2682977 RepID=A0A7C9LLM7_9DEIO|nr:hypothetical protein [Deinococcus arboris]MVN85796.1 hypothetical protein [Deinococcus arboris]